MDYKETFQVMRYFGLFACPLGNGDWMVGSANHIYHISIQDNHYKDILVSISPTLAEAVINWMTDYEVPATL